MFLTRAGPSVPFYNYHAGMASIRADCSNAFSTAKPGLQFLHISGHRHCTPYTRKTARDRKEARWGRSRRPRSLAARSPAVLAFFPVSLFPLARLAAYSSVDLQSSTSCSWRLSKSGVWNVSSGWGHNAPCGISSSQRFGASRFRLTLPWLLSIVPDPPQGQDITVRRPVQQRLNCISKDGAGPRSKAQGALGQPRLPTPDPCCPLQNGTGRRRRYQQGISRGL